MLDSTDGRLIVEFSGTEEKIDMIFKKLDSVNVLESIRTGKLGMRIGL